MSRLVWTQHRKIRTAGRFQIELVTPGMWALTDTGNGGIPTIVRTSRSIRSLELTACEIERKRELGRRAIVYLGLLAMALAGLTISSFSTAAWSSLFIIASSSTMLWAALGFLSSLTDRSWETVRQTYQ